MSDSALTLAAASLAAVVSMFNLFTTAGLNRRSEERAAHREVLGRHLTELAAAIVQVVATATMLRETLLDRASPDKRRRWQSRAEEAITALKGVRPKIRYPLYGLDEGIRTLSRIPHWIANYTGDRAPLGADLIDRADRLRQALDTAISRSYRRGRPPTRWDRWRVDRESAAARTLWKRDFGGREQAKQTEH